MGTSSRIHFRRCPPMDREGRRIGIAPGEYRHGRGAAIATSAAVSPDGWRAARFVIPTGARSAQWRDLLSNRAQPARQLSFRSEPGSAASSGQEESVTSQLRFSVLVLPNVPWPELLRRCRHVEDLGFDSIGLADHLVD